MLTFARVRALTIVAVLVIGALIAVYLAMSRDSTGAASAQRGCPEGSVLANLTLPDAQDVKINVYNGTNQAGLATQVAEDFANRDFQVLESADSETAVEDAVAVLRYGPQTVGAAQVLDAYFLNDAIEEFDIERDDDVVDVIIGDQFRQLATETEVRQAIAEAGSPIAPPGTCPQAD
ncbi:MAG TPA: LytR C-terminal domain-containing protein [Natronosporangium sp.]